MKKIINTLRSRFFISSFLIVLEVIEIIVFVQFLSHYFFLLWIMAYITSFVAFISVVNMKSNPDYKIPWISIILAVPPYGALFFGMFYKVQFSKREEKFLVKTEARLIAKHKSVFIPEELNNDRRAYNLARALSEESRCGVYGNTVSEYFPLGDDFFPRYLEDLKNAERYIFMEYFIIEAGIMWEAILDILKKKAESGVEVRLIYDDIGCMKTVPEKYYAELNSMDIHTIPFAKLRPKANSRYNNRTHRKITVIDGVVGYTGGINIADEYINAKKRFGHWKDSAVRLEGEAVRALCNLFLFNWDLAHLTTTSHSLYLPEKQAVSPKGKGYYIPFGAGPSSIYATPVAKNMYLNLINSAVDYVYITTPYLIIDYELTNAILNGARRGVDIRIITPHIPDKKLVFLMTRSSYEQFLEAGVRIYEYTPGFIHAKNLICDDLFAVCGTINLDYRSLAHHFENAVWMYKTETLNSMKEDFLKTMEMSIEYSLGLSRMKPMEKILKFGLKLFAPML